MWNKKFFSATDEDIMNGKASDVYFSLNKKFINENKEIIAEITSSSSEKWIVFSGLAEILNLLEGKDVSVNAIEEGVTIPLRDAKKIPIPFIQISGKYREIMEFETAILGMICQSTGISTESGKVFRECRGKPFFSFGIRRMHPSISPMIDRAAYIGGASGVSGILGAKLTGTDPVGTMPHSAALIMGEEKAWEFIVNNMPKGRRVILIDTFGDEKFKAIEAAEKFPDIDYIRLDTPSSRRGNFPNIIREVRWELDLRGHENVKIMVSGGIRVEQIPELIDAGVEAFGIGTSISSAKSIDFGMDIVEVEGINITKRGKFSGKKKVFRCEECGKVYVLPEKSEIPVCHDNKMNLILKEKLKNGKKVDEPEVGQIRKKAIQEIYKYSKLYDSL
ncbi:nicotinate phosphoribosyltransferase [Caldiplasma sukawensis]